MCKCCSTTQKQLCVFGCGAFLLLVALIVGLLWPTLAWNILYSRLTLEEGSSNYENWIETPLPMYMEITMFNWTNHDKVRDTEVKPLLTECGPYVFLEHHKRTNITWNENGTITYNQIKTWQFMPNMSNGSLDDEITNLNVVSATVAYMARRSAVEIFGANLILNLRGGSLFVTKTVRELLFDGYEDPVLTFLNNGNSSAIHIPYETFGWFVERNGSWSYDGVFNMNTGQNDITKMGMLNTWNDEPTTNFYSDGCSMINGTTGELWPPKLSTKGDITLFVSDVCRSISLAPQAEEIDIFGVRGTRWIGDERVFDNGENYPPNQCFCTGEQCPDLKPGLVNISDCRYGAPAFMSYPHFYLGDSSFVNAVDGLNPSQEKHEFAMTLEPNTGIPLQVNARMQVNIFLQPIEGITIYNGVSPIMIPMLWFTQTVEIDEDVASQARLAVLLPKIGVYASIGVAGLGAILLIIGIILTLTKSWSRPRLDESDNELET